MISTRRNHSTPIQPRMLTVERHHLCRSVARLEIDNDDLRDRLAASEQAGAATTQKPVGVAPVKGEPLGEADAHLGPSENPPPSTAGQLSRQTPTGIESTATLARVCAVGATCPGIHQAALSPKQLESRAGNGLGSKGKLHGYLACIGQGPCRYHVTEQFRNFKAQKSLSTGQALTQ